MAKAVFCKTAVSIQELIDVSNLQKERGISFFVIKIIGSTPQQFHGFRRELYEYYRFLYDCKEDMFFDAQKNGYQCILIKTSQRKEGFLVETEGYAHARYCAYVPDCGKLSLEGVETVKNVSLSHETKIVQGFYGQCPLQQGSNYRKAG